MSNVLVIGATSAIAEQFARLQAARGDALFLLGRNTIRLQAIAADLRIRSGVEVSITTLDIGDLDAHAEAIDRAWRQMGSIDIVLIAHGTLPDQRAAEGDVVLAVREFTLNATATIALMTVLAARLETQGSGTLAVISSVAGDRGRASNYLYGSAKAAVTAFASGLRQRLHGTVNVLTIKPGFVDTPMTRDFPKGALWVGPERIAKGILKAIDSGRSVAYLPGFWWVIMRIITHLPELVFRRIKL